MSGKANGSWCGPEPVLNLDAIRAVRERIGERGRKYDQSQPYRSCGTPCCLAGHAYAHAEERGGGFLWGAAPADWETQEGIAREMLGLTRDEAKMLFNTYWPVEWLLAAGCRKPAMARCEAAEGTAEDMQADVPEAADGPYVQPERREVLAVLDRIEVTGVFPGTEETGRGSGGAVQAEC